AGPGTGDRDRKDGRDADRQRRERKDMARDREDRGPGRGPAEASARPDGDAEGARPTREAEGAEDADGCRAARNFRGLHRIQSSRAQILRRHQRARRPRPATAQPSPFFANAVGRAWFYSRRSLLLGIILRELQAVLGTTQIKTRRSHMERTDYTTKHLDLAAYLIVIGHECFGLDGAPGRKRIFRFPVA